MVLPAPGVATARKSGASDATKASKAAFCHGRRRIVLLIRGAAESATARQQCHPRPAANAAASDPRGPRGAREVGDGGSDGFGPRPQRAWMVRSSVGPEARRRQPQRDTAERATSSERARRLSAGRGRASRHLVAPRRAILTTVRICFVCLGNICRSPAAAAVFLARAAAAGIDVTVESAGTGDYHIGEGAHPSTMAEAGRRGITIEHSARQFTVADFDRFDLVVAMDGANRRDLLRLAPGRGGAGQGRAAALVRRRRLRRRSTSLTRGAFRPRPTRRCSTCSTRRAAGSSATLPTPRPVRDRRPARRARRGARGDRGPADQRRRHRPGVPPRHAGRPAVRQDPSGPDAAPVRARARRSPGARRGRRRRRARRRPGDRIGPRPAVGRRRPEDGAAPTRCSAPSWRRCTASTGPHFGGLAGAPSGYLGSQPVDLTPTASWPELFVERRVRPLAARAVALGRLDAVANDLVDQVARRRRRAVRSARASVACSTATCGPATGSWTARASTGSIDPAAYWGHREVDLAMMALFGGFGRGAYAAYDQRLPVGRAGGGAGSAGTSCRRCSSTPSCSGGRTARRRHRAAPLRLTSGLDGDHGDDDATPRSRAIGAAYVTHFGMVR